MTEQEHTEIQEEIIKRARHDAGFAVAYALIECASALNQCAAELSTLSDIAHSLRET